MRQFQYLCAFHPSSGFAENPARPVIRDATTHEQLAALFEKGTHVDAVPMLEPVVGVDPSVNNVPIDLIGSSDILCFGGIATLVPKKAMLHIPKNLENRFVFSAGSQIRRWADFYAVNRGWITTVTISFRQTVGNEAMGEKAAKRVRKNPNVVVATFQGGPISMLPLKPPLDESGATVEKAIEK